MLPRYCARSAAFAAALSRIWQTLEVVKCQQKLGPDLMGHPVLQYNKGRIRSTLSPETSHLLEGFAQTQSK